MAVATNFYPVLKRVLIDAPVSSEFEYTLVAGSTGKLYAQIVNGAPFDVYLAADQTYPARLVDDELAERGTQFTYATGRLALWSRKPGLVTADNARDLLSGDVRTLAIANPELAPYGAAAIEALRALGLESVLSSRLVMGENIGQAFALVATGNAEFGIVSLSTAVATLPGLEGSHWRIPARLHSPIRQDAVLLTRARDNMAAIELLRYLRGDRAQAQIAAAGYSRE